MRSGPSLGLSLKLKAAHRLDTEKRDLLSRKTALTKTNEQKKLKLDEVEKQLDNILEVRVRPTAAIAPCELMRAQRAKTVQGQMASF